MPSPLKGIPNISEEVIQDQRQPQLDTPKLLLKNESSWIAAKKICYLVTKNDITTVIAKRVSFL